MPGVNVKRISCLFILGILSFFLFYGYAGKQKFTKSMDPAKPPDKISFNGQYLPFYGYTIISMVSGQHDYLVIEQFLKDTKTLSKYLAPLPATSYHITIFDIFTQRKVPEKYASVSGNVPSEHWARALGILKDDLTAAKHICSKVTERLSFHKTTFQLGKQPGNGFSVRGSLNNENLVSNLRNQFFEIFPNSSSRNVKYHLSLGYLFKKIDKDDMDNINNELDQLWELINENYSLQTPDVYYFETMTAFIPLQDLDKAAH